MTKIKKVTGREIIDSRGNPTVEVECELESGAVAVAGVPSGASTGIHEALELRDADKARYNGLGVLNAVNNVNTIINENISGKEFDQKSLDEALINLDGTKNKSKLGANAILGVSLAFARAVANEKKINLYEYLGSLVGNTEYALPEPMFNVINGGKHADSGLDIQEFMIIPVGIKTFKEKVRVVSEVISALKKVLVEKGFGVGVGDEGGFAPKLASNEEAFDILIMAIQNAGYTTEQIKIGIDAAASSFFFEGMYKLKIAGEEKSFNTDEMIAWYEKLVSTYPIISIEDGLDEEDWAGFVSLNKKLGDKIKIIGDDLLVTNIEKIQKAISENAVNSVLIKLNQIGTLSETIDAIQMTKKQNWNAIVSHRSGETNDTFIADLAVGLSCGYIKSGSLTREERVCKYNRLMEIEENLLSK
ncbi:MAG: phosphopyruvate hydratase [Candidatus Nomurabacteria bacterium]|nr:phosphopyruvate hydratase [Candidatus Nomurabacteria bacterium]